MMALNFQAAKHKKMLMERTKNCTVRLGDVSAEFPENSIVWITTGKKGEPKHKLYTAFLDKVRVKTMGTLTSAIRTRRLTPSMNSWRISRKSTSVASSRKTRSRSYTFPKCMTIWHESFTFKCPRLMET